MKVAAKEISKKKEIKYSTGIRTHNIVSAYHVRIMRGMHDLETIMIFG